MDIPLQLVVYGFEKIKILEGAKSLNTLEDENNNEFAVASNLGRKEQDTSILDDWHKQDENACYLSEPWGRYNVFQAELEKLSIISKIRILTPNMELHSRTDGFTDFASLAGGI